MVKELIRASMLMVFPIGNKGWGYWVSAIRSRYFFIFCSRSGSHMKRNTRLFKAMSHRSQIGRQQPSAQVRHWFLARRPQRKQRSRLMPIVV